MPLSILSSITKIGFENDRNSVYDTFTNYNFMEIIQPYNTYTTYDLNPSAIVGWTCTGHFALANGNGGGFGFIDCPYQQFAIIQRSGNFSQSVNLYNTLYIILLGSSSSWRL